MAVPFITFYFRQTVYTQIEIYKKIVRRARILYAMDSAANWPVNPWVPQQQCQSTERSTKSTTESQSVFLILVIEVLIRKATHGHRLAE